MISFKVNFRVTANKGMVSLTFKATQRAGSWKSLSQIHAARDTDKGNVMSSKFRWHVLLVLSVWKRQILFIS